MGMKGVCETGFFLTRVICMQPILLDKIGKRFPHWLPILNLHSSRPMVLWHAYIKCIKNQKKSLQILAGEQHYYFNILVQYVECPVGN